jgi:hypothetical protein
MASYLILGAGKFGRLALKRLGRRDPKAEFLLVDKSPAALIEARRAAPGPVACVAQEAAAFLAAGLRPPAPWDWLIPMVNLHVAYAWFRATPAGARGWETIPVPASLTALAPAGWRGPAGELYLSRAEHLCPDDCPEPEGACPVSGRAWAAPLCQALAATVVPGFLVLVIESRQLAPGVGGYPPGDLLEMARKLAPYTGQALIATACRCHGVVHGLNRQGVLTS